MTQQQSRLPRPPQSPNLGSEANLKDMVQAEVCRRSLHEFAKYIWKEVDPSKELITDFYFKAMCDHLEACFRREIKRLAINIPPRHGKSTIVRILFPAWVWLNNPSERFLATTYQKRLTLRDSKILRKVIKSAAYQKLVRNLPKIPNWQLSKDMKTIEGWETTERGAMHSYSLGGTTGEGCDFLIIDDLMSVTMARSDIERLNALDYYDATLTSRIDRPATGVKIIIMQRLHEFDLIGHVLADNIEGWEHLCLPCEYESDHRWKSKTSLGFVDPRTVEGELLCPAITPREEVEKMKRTMMDAEWSSQYRQDPTPKGGGIILKEWWKETTLAEQQKRDGVFTIVSYDPAYSEKQNITASYTARVTLRVFREWLPDGSGYRHRICLMGAKQARWGFPEFEAELLRHARETKPDLILVENKASGKSIVQSVQRQLDNVASFDPTKLGDKIERMATIAPLVMAGNFFYIPSHKQSAEAVDIISRFPADNDDIPDAFSQAVHQLVKMRLIKSEDDADYVTTVSTYSQKKQTQGAYYG